MSRGARAVTYVEQGCSGETEAPRKRLKCPKKLSFARPLFQVQKSAKWRLGGDLAAAHLWCVQTKGTFKMIKTTVLTLLAAATLATASAPAFAVSDRPFGDGDEWRDFKANSILTQLRQNGVDATSVEEWSGLVRAYVQTEDGRQVMEFYNPHSLQPVQP
jgi:hypothetical protein